MPERTSPPDPVQILCDDIYRQVMTQRKHIETGQFQAAEGYIAVVSALLNQLKFYLPGVNESGVPREYPVAAATLATALTLHNENVQRLEHAATAMQQMLITGRERAAHVQEYRNIQRRRRPGG